jgi:hypothetical protein
MDIKEWLENEESILKLEEELSERKRIRNLAEESCNKGNIFLNLYAQIRLKTLFRSQNTSYYWDNIVNEIIDLDCKVFEDDGYTITVNYKGNDIQLWNENKYYDWLCPYINVKCLNRLPSFYTMLRFKKWFNNKIKRSVLK